MPHELLPIMPPSVFRECVAGSGPNVSPCSFCALARSVSRMQPGCTVAVRASGSMSSTRSMYLEQSRIDGDVGRLSCEAGAAAAHRDRRAVLAADPHRRDHVVLVAGQHHADRHLPVVRSIGGVRGPAPGVEADLARGPRRQFPRQRPRVGRRDPRPAGPPWHGAHAGVVRVAPCRVHHGEARAFLLSARRSCASWHQAAYRWASRRLKR